MTEDTFEGRCTCGAVRYRLSSGPLIVHCCHCTWCQRETGSAFAINAMIESDRLSWTGAIDEVLTPSASGKDQTIVRCPTCRTALWSHYAGAGRLVSFVRVGTLEEPDRLPPDVHIFAASKQAWLTLPASARVFDAYYVADAEWPADRLERRAALRARR